MSRVRWDRAGDGVRRGTPRVENLALVPASLLPHRVTYQRLANQLPAGAVLIVLPTDDSPEHQTLQQAATRLRAKGHPVVTIPVDELLTHTTSRPSPRAATADASPPRAPASVPPPAAPPTAGTPLALPPFMHELRLVHIDASARPARYVLLQWQPTLWDRLALVQVTGTLGHPGRARVLLETDAPTPHLDEPTRQRLQRRLQRGYQVADWQ